MGFVGFLWKNLSLATAEPCAQFSRGYQTVVDELPHKL